MRRKYKRPPRGLSHHEIIMFNIERVTERGCWEVRSNHPFGYGMIQIDGVRDVSHRWSWRIYKGEIPTEMQVLHQCDNPPCVNPEHLFLGTDLDNHRDKTRKLRHGRMKLSIETVNKIRELRGAGHGPVIIARKLNIPASTVGNIFYKNSWHYV